MKPWIERDPLRFAGEQVGGVEDQRHLDQLGGLDLEGAAADPAARAVDALPGAEHDDQEEDRAGEEIGVGAGSRPARGGR